MSPKAQATAVKYTGDTARGYLAKRINKIKWTCEQQIVDGMTEYAVRSLELQLGILMRM